MDKIKVNPRKVRGLGNIMAKRSCEDFLVHRSVIDVHDDYNTGNLGVFTIEDGYLKVTFSDENEYCSYLLKDGYLYVTTDLPKSAFNYDKQTGLLTCAPEFIAQDFFTLNPQGSIDGDAVASVSLIVSPNEIYEGESTVLTSTVRNANNAPVEDVAVAFYDGSTLLGSRNTNSNGVATYSYMPETIGTVTLHSVCRNVRSSNVNLTVNENIIENNDPASINILVSPGTTISAGNAVAAIITVHDEDNHVCTNIPIYESTDNGSNYTYIGTTNSNGQITITQRNVQTSFNWKFRVGTDGITSEVVPITVSAGTISSITCISDKSVVIKNNPITLTSSVTYSQGTFEGITVTFYNGNVRLGSAETNSNGVATLDYTPTSAGNLSITAKVDNTISSPISVKVKNDNDPANINVSVTPSTTVEVGTSYTVTATVTDTDGDPCVGVELYYPSNGGSTYVRVGTTNDNGQLSKTSTYYGSCSWDYIFRVGTNGITSSSTHVTIVDSSVDTVSINALPVYLGESTIISATLLKNNAAVSGKTVRFYAKAPGRANDTYLGTGVTDSNGVATYNYTPDTYGVWEFYATYAEIGSRTSVRIKQVIHHIVLNTDNEVNWNENEAFTVTLYDSNGDVVIDSRNVRLYIDNQLYSQSYVVESNGTCSGYYKITDDEFGGHESEHIWSTTIYAVSENVNSNTVNITVTATGYIPDDPYTVGKLGEFSIENDDLIVTFTDTPLCTYQVVNGDLIVTTDAPNKFRIINGVLYYTP